MEEALVEPCQITEPPRGPIRTLLGTSTMGTGEARETAGGMAGAANGRQQHHAKIQKFLGLGDPPGGRFCPQNLAELHLDGDPNQVRMAFGTELLLEQGRSVGNGLVRNFQHIGDFDDLVAPAQ